MKTGTFPRDHSTPGLQTYLQDINATPLLSREDERILAGRIAAGDPAARDHMVRANLRLVVNIARGSIGRGLSLDDLIAEGNLGLMRAVEGFDGDMEVRFSTYATYWIKQSMRRAVMNQGQSIRVPAHLVCLMAKWWRATANLSERLGREPTPEEVGKALRLSRRRLGIVTQAIQVKKAMNSLEPSNEHENGWDHLVDRRSGDTDNLQLEADDLDRICRGLDQLDKRKAAVIRMRFGLGTCDPMTLEDVGEQLGITRERVRQLQKDALRQLRIGA
jgi:RNA polymerase primary sigma factor